MMWHGMTCWHCWGIWLSTASFLESRYTDFEAKPSHGVGNQPAACVACWIYDPRRPSNPCERWEDWDDMRWIIAPLLSLLNSEQSILDLSLLRWSQFTRLNQCLHPYPLQMTTRELTLRVLERLCHPGSKDIMSCPCAQNLLSAAHLQLLLALEAKELPPTSLWSTLGKIPQTERQHLPKDLNLQVPVFVPMTISAAQEEEEEEERRRRRSAKRFLSKSGILPATAMGLNFWSIQLWILYKSPQDLSRSLKTF